MKSNHMEVLATLEDNQFKIPFKEGKFPLPLALDIFLRDGWTLVSMSPFKLAKINMDAISMEFATIQYLLVLRKTEPANES